MDISFCRRCGAKVVQQAPGQYRCNNGHDLYYKNYPAIGVLFLNDRGEVLVAKRGIEPFMGRYDLPGGFVEYNERAEDAAVREIHEELGLAPADYSNLVFLCTQINKKYDYQGETHSIHSVFFTAIIKPGVEPVAQDDVASIEWVSIDTFNASKMPFTDASRAFRFLQDLRRSD